MIDLYIFTLSLLETVLWMILTISLLLQVSLRRPGCSSWRNTSMGVRWKQFGVCSLGFGILWISPEWISKLGFQTATLRKVGRALSELKNKGLEYILCSPARWRAVCGGGWILSVVGSPHHPWPQGHCSGKWGDLFVLNSDLSLFIGWVRPEVACFQLLGLVFYWQNITSSFRNWDNEGGDEECAFRGLCLEKKERESTSGFSDIKWPL